MGRSKGSAVAGAGAKGCCRPAATLATSAVAAATAALHFAENRAYHRHLQYLPDAAVARVSCLQTENGFYYSYYGNLVEAESASAGLKKIVWDTQSEYPETLNALRRFNIYQEVLLALAYRALRAGGLALVDAWAFFRFVLLSHNSIGQAAIALLAAEVSGNPIAGVLCFVLAFLNRFQMSRLGSYASADLREHWGIPLLWVQTLCLWHLLAGTSSTGRGQRLLKVAFGVTTFLFIVSWQFSPFLLLLQATSLYFVCLVAGYSSVRPVVVSIINAYLAAMASAFVVHFGSPYLLTSPFLAQIVALKVSTSLRSLCTPSRAAPRESTSCARACLSWAGRRGLDVLEGLVALVAFACILKAMAPFATADTHVYELLCTKAAVVNDWLPERLRLPASRLPECTEPSFNARLYLIMGVFKELEEASINLYRVTTAGPAAAVTCALVLLRCLCSTVLPRGAPAKKSLGPPTKPEATPEEGTAADGLRRRKVTSSKVAKGQGANGAVTPGPADAEDDKGAIDDTQNAEMEEAALLFFVLQFLCFLLLGALVNRLRVAFAPLMVVLASSCCGPRLFSVGPLRRSGRVRLILLGVLACVHLGYLGYVLRLMPCAGPEEGICSQMAEKKTSDGDLVDLMEWMNEQLPRNLSVLASMNLAGTLRAFTANPLIIHPQFESQNLRKRVQMAYELYHCGSEESFAQTMRKLHAEVVVFEYARCFFTPYILDDRRKNCIQSKHEPEDQLCLKLHVSTGRFRLLFMNGGYGVFGLQDLPAAGIGDDLSPVAVEQALAERHTWAPYVERCAATQGEACAGRLSETAATWLHGLKRPKVAHTIRQLMLRHFPKNGFVAYHMGRYLDYDTKSPREAGKNYEWAAKQMPNNAMVLKEYLMWLDMEAKDHVTIRKIFETRGGGRRGPRNSQGQDMKPLLELTGAGAPELMCEAAVSAKEMGMHDFSDRLWARAVEMAPLSSCIRNNWKLLYPDRDYDQVHTLWVKFWAFAAAGVTHDVGSHHFPAVRFALPRNFTLSPAARVQTVG